MAKLKTLRDEVNIEEEMRPVLDMYGMLLLSTRWHLDRENGQNFSAPVYMAKTRATCIRVTDDHYLQHPLKISL